MPLQRLHPLDGNAAALDAVEGLVVGFFAFFLMPLASSFMKSGIYSSASDRGPSSGTEKCRRLLTLLATLSAAAITELAAARTPAAIWEQISLPQLYADDAMLLRELNLLRMSCTDEATVAFRLFMAEDTVPFAELSTDFQTLSRAFCTPDAPFDTALWISFHALLMLVLMLSHAVFAPVCTEVHAAAIVLSSVAMPEVTVDWMLAQELEIVEDIPFQELCTSAAAVVHALSMLVLTCEVEESVLPVMASQMPPKKPEMPSHADLAAAEMLSQAVLAAIFIPSHAVDRLVESVDAAVVTVVEIPVHAVEIPVLTPSHAVDAVVLMPSHTVESAVESVAAAVPTAVEISVQAVEMLVFTPSHAVVAVVLIPSQAEESPVESVETAVPTVVEMFVQAVEMPVLMPFQAVVATVLIPVHAVESVLPTTDTAPEMRPFMPFHAPEITPVIPLHTVDATPLMPSHAPDQSPEMRLMTELMMPLITFITPLTTPEMAFHTVVKAVWMPERMPPRKVDIPPNTVFVVPSISPALPPKPWLITSASSSMLQLLLMGAPPSCNGA